MEVTVNNLTVSITEVLFYIKYDVILSLTVKQKIYPTVIFIFQVSVLKLTFLY